VGAGNWKRLARDPDERARMVRVRVVKCMVEFGCKELDAVAASMVYKKIAKSNLGFCGTMRRDGES